MVIFITNLRCLAVKLLRFSSKISGIPSQQNFFFQQPNFSAELEENPWKELATPLINWQLFLLEAPDSVESSGPCFNWMRQPQ
jgi:hypothetical protein